MVGEMLEVFAGGGEDGGTQAKGNGVMSSDYRFWAFNGNDFDHRSKELLLGGGMSEVGLGIFPLADTGFYVVTLSAANFLVNFSGVQKTDSGNRFKGHAVTFHGSGGREWAELGFLVGWPSGLIRAKSREEILKKGRKNGLIHEHASGGIAPLARGETGRLGHGVGGPGKIGILENQGCIFSAELQSHIFRRI